MEEDTRYSRPTATHPIHCAACLAPVFVSVIHLCVCVYTCVCLMYAGQAYTTRPGTPLHVVAARAAICGSVLTTRLTAHHRYCPTSTRPLTYAHALGLPDHTHYVAARCTVLLCVSHGTKVYAYTPYKTTQCNTVLQPLAPSCIALQIPITYVHTLGAQDQKSKFCSVL